MAGHGISTQACPTSVSTQDYTKSGLGTPKGGLFFGTYNDTINTDEPGLLISVGATDLSGNGAMGMTGAANAVGTSDNRRISQSDELIRIAEPPGTDVGDIQGNYNATVTDGIQVDWVATSATARYVSALMFNEGIADFDAQYLSVDAGASTSVTLSFQADIVLYWDVGTIDEFASNAHEAAFSIYDRVNDSYASVVTGALHGDTTPSSSEHFSTTHVVGSINLSTGGVFNDFTLGSFSGTGFTMTRNGGSDSTDFIMVAIRLDAGYSAKVGTFSAPTSTGVTSVITGLSFEPDMALFICNNQTSAGGSTSSGTICMGATDGTNQFTAGGRYEDLDSATNTDTDSWHNNDNCIYMQSNTGTLISEAAFSAFQSDGVDLNFSTATTAIQVGYLVIGAAAAAADTPLSAGGIILNP